MEYKDLLLEKSGGVATVTLNAPEKMNALTFGIRRSLSQVSIDLAADDDVRAVIVTGAGRGFCAGGDLSGDGRVEPTRQQRIEFLGPDHGTHAFFRLDKPVISAVNGAAVGAGLSLALSTDIRIASETARFGAVFVLRGLTPDCGISYWLPGAVGIAKAMEMMCTGDIIDAAEAKRLGIVSQVVPPEALMDTARELATRIAQQPPFSVALTKRMVYRSIRDSWDRHVEIESIANQISRQTEDHREAVRAFFERRPQPEFRGR
jgi:2-(1,2-epoxy-1,2-dihydrophenyl)acetyl-CoA isomerase